MPSPRTRYRALRRALAAVALASLATVSAPSARAQNIFSQDIFSPAATTSDSQAVAPQAPPSATSPAQTAATPAGVLRHLTNNIQGFRLSGEIAASEWPLYLTASQSQYKLRFQIGYLSAVSVMPEASVLTLAINGVVVGRTHIRGAAGVRTIAFDIPNGLLKSGFNSVRISAEQRHRVDCSIKATYELWTQIDPTLTGLMLPNTDSGVTNIGDLPALAPDGEGALPIRAVLPTHATPHDINRLLRAVELISLVGRFDQPVVDIGPLAGGEYGVNLVIGKVANLSRRMPDLPLSGVAGPRVVVVPARPERRTTIIITGSTEQDVDAALEQIVAAHDVSGTPSGLMAAKAFPGFRMEGGQRITLRQLGVHSEEFSGRLFRAGFNLLMPPDFYAADYAKVFVDLAGGYSRGLSGQAEVVVKVNGRDASSLQLPNRNGDVFKNKSIPLPLGYLRPGFNRIDIEAHLPKRSDRACDPLKAVEGGNRFLFLDSTAIEIPPIARIARMPDLAVTATGGFPYARLGSKPKLWLPKPDRQSVAAAASIAAHLAVSAGGPIDFKFTATQPAAKAGPVLVVAPATSIGRSLLGAVGLDPAQIANAWRDRFSDPPKQKADAEISKYEADARHRNALERNAPAACHMSRPVGGFASQLAPSAGWPRATAGALGSNGVLPAAPLGYEHGSAGLAREWKKRIGGGNPWRKWQTDVPGAASDLLHWAAAQVGSWFGEQSVPVHRKSAVDRETSLIIAQDILGDDAADVWTVVTAPTSKQLLESVGCLVDPRVWGQLSGRMSALDASDVRANRSGKASWRAPARRSWPR